MSATEEKGMGRRAVLTSQELRSNRAAFEQTAVTHQPGEVGPIDGGPEERVGRLIGGGDEYLEIDPHETCHSGNILGKTLVLPVPNQLRVLYPVFMRGLQGDRPAACPLDEFDVEYLGETF